MNHGRSLAAGAFVCLLSTLSAGTARAQTSEPPGPYVIDMRGITSGLPNAAEFFPSDVVNTVVPGRGFGVDAGAHVYLSRLGPSRLGIGAQVIWLRGTAQPAPPAAVSGSTTKTVINPSSIHATFSSIAPQLSFNFGSRSGWSYLSGGVGLGELATSALREGLPPSRSTSGQVMALNAGGGAKWFMKERLAFGLDVRFHRLAAGAATPSTTLFAVSVGMSVR